MCTACTPKWSLLGLTLLAGFAIWVPAVAEEGAALGATAQCGFESWPEGARAEAVIGDGRGAVGGHRAGPEAETERGGGSMSAPRAPFRCGAGSRGGIQDLWSPAGEFALRGTRRRGSTC